MMREHLFSSTSRSRRLATSVALAVVAVSCTENLPVGPDTFTARLQIMNARDTIVVGDSITAQVQALDGAGRSIQSLPFAWVSADTSIVGFAAAAAGNPEATSGRTKTMIGRRTGQSVVTAALSDLRFVASNATRTTTVVVGGVRLLTSRDSTLTAVNDTAVAIASGLVRSNGSLVPRASQGIRWTHLGTRTTVIGQGDTIRYIARANGVDTLIATATFCLATAKCADTAIVRVNQQVTLSLSTRSLLAWSFGDSVSPSATLADRRGSGLPGASIRFVPMTAADSVVVKVTAPVGVSNPANGSMATPRLVAAANGSARVLVLAYGADGLSIVAADSVTAVVRQVARRIAVEPLRVIMTANDTLPIKPVARDARGAVIADATLSMDPAGITLNGNLVGPTVIGTLPTLAAITPSLSGVALPQNHPQAPQVGVTVDPSLITLLPVDTAKAGNRVRVINFTVLDSNAMPARARWIDFGASFGPVPDPVQTDVNGAVSTAWTPLDSAGSYTLSAVLTGLAPLAAQADSAGRVLLRRSIVVVADDPSATKSTVGISATTIVAGGTATVTVTVKDRFGNVVKTATPAAFTMTSTAGGTFSAAVCAAGECTATYTAPAGPGNETISVKILGVEILLSPIAVIIT